MSDATLLATAKDWAAAGHALAVATVTRTWGSAPRPAGSQMFVRDDGLFAGSVSGGCVEGAVIEEAQAAMGDAKVRRLQFGIANEDAWAVGLACGGTIEILVAPLAAAPAADLLGRAHAAVTANTPFVWASATDSGEQRLLLPDSGSDNALARAAARAAESDVSGEADADGSRWFLAVFNPPVDLVVIGAVHIAQDLVQIARLAGFAVRVIDPRRGFASAERFPGVTLVPEWPDEALSAAPLGRRSAVVAVTHDPKIDDPALSTALRSPAFYIGALGSRQTHARRLERLRALGFGDDDLARIHGPIGLAIGARSPAEIAIAILAEITRDLRLASAKNQPGG